MKFNCYVLCTFLILSCISVMPQTLQTNFPVTNGSVNAVVNSGGNIYLGGSFSYVGPNTGRGVAIDTATGNYISGFPDINGPVYAVASDSAGGWYIGGDFTMVGGQARNSLAHIKSDKTVDTWNPNINDGLGNNQPVYTIVKSGSLIYVGGIFTQVGSTLRTNVAAIDSSTGLANSWNPSPDNVVYSIVVTPQYTFLGGSFTYFNGASDTTSPGNIPGSYPINKRQGVAELFTGTTILTQWIANIAGGVTNGVNPYGLTNVTSVYAMQLVNGYLYCAGNFSSLGNNSTYGLTSIDTINSYTLTATGFTPNKNTTLKFRPVTAMAISGDTIFVGGQFLYFGALSAVKNHIAAVLISTKAAISTWNPNIAINVSSSNEISNPYYVNSIVVANGTLYVSGKFITINTSVSRWNMAAISQSGTGTVTSWNPNASAEVHSIALQGSTLYAGGNFTSVNGQTRNNLCEINAASGTLTSWNPNPNSFINALTHSGTTLFAAGNFTSIGGQSRQYLAAIDTATGLATSWQANSGGGISCLAVGNSQLYVGGTFSAIGGVSSGDSTRNDIAALDLTTGAVSAWNPSADGTVYSLAVSGSNVYAGGSFSNIGGQLRNDIAALDATTGTATSWNPTANGLVNSIAVSGSILYAGGNFTQMGSSTRNCIAAINIADTGTTTTWNPNITSTGTPVVNTIFVNGSTIYAGGAFGSVGASVRDNLAAIDASTGLATTWSPNPDSYVYSVVPDPTSQVVYIGGAFSDIFSATSSNFGVVTNPGDAALPVELTSFSATLDGSTAILTWKTSTEINSYGFEIEKSTDNIHFNKIGFVKGADNSSSPKKYSFNDSKIFTGKYYYRIKQIDNNGQFKYSNIVEIKAGLTPDKFSLAQNYPNPFNPSTVISYEIPKDGLVSLKVFDIIGREVSTLVNKYQTAGSYNVTFNAYNLSSGIYFYQLKSGSYNSIRKLILLK